MRRSGAHLRARDGDGDQETTTLELFFDLVFVLAVTQLSHLLIADLSWRGAGRAGFLLLAVWWAWVNTTWLLNWLDPLSLAVRRAVLTGALLSLLLSASLPRAFAAEAGLFAGAYIAFGLGRNLAGVRLAQGHALRPMLEALLTWTAAAAPLWIAGAVVDGTARSVLWVAALGVEVAAPALGYPLPGRGRIAEPPLALAGAHFADRFQGFVIIALGESIAVTGAVAADRGLTPTSALALAIAFVQAASTWWLYFDTSAVQAKRQIAAAQDAVALARDAFTYLHLPIVAGVIVTAVGDDILLAHPGEQLDAGAALVTLGGPALFLVGTLGFRWRMIGRVGIERPGALVALAGALLLTTVLPAIGVAGVVAAVLTGLVLAEDRQHDALAA